jgi:hypothetical protein
MMKAILKMGTLLGIVILTGCGSEESSPRFQGRIVSHVDAYGSGTGNESSLRRKGSMTSGFDYGDSSKPDWTSDIKWSFLRQDGEIDVYRVEWIFSPKSGTSGTKVKEVNFDGTKSVTVFSNQWQVISVEPGRTKTNSQPGGPANGSQPIRSETNRTSPAAGSRR